MKLGRVYAGRIAAIARGDRIDKDYIGEDKSCVLIVYQMIRRWNRLAFWCQSNTLGPERTHMQPHGGRARPAVKSKCDGPRSWIGAILSIINIEDAGAGFLSLISQ